MKKIILSVVIALLATMQVNAQENFKQTETETMQNTTNNAASEIADKMGEAMAAATDVISSGMGEFITSFTKTMMKMSAFIEVCKDEDKNSAPMTQELAKNIIQAASPNNTDDFVIEIDDQTGEFAKATYQLGESQISIQLAKSYCLAIAEDMTKEMERSMNDAATNTKEVMEKAVEESSLNKGLSDEKNYPNIEKNKPTIIIADENIDMDKFQPFAINGFDGSKAIDNEKQSAYIFGFIGSLGIRAKAQGGNYNQAVEQVIRQINIQELQQIIGSETVSEIKARLNSKIENKIIELNAQTENKTLK